MYYEQHTVKKQDVPEYRYRWRPGSRQDDPQDLIRDDHIQTYVSQEKRVYSFRTKRPKNDSSTAVVPSDSLLRKPPEEKRGVEAYLATYKAALQALNDEAGQVSGNSGYGAMDKGHLFSSFKFNANIRPIEGRTAIALTGKASGQVLYRPFVSAVSVNPRPVYYRPGENLHLPTEVYNTIQELVASTVPDKINGSLGQDIVDLAELPRLISHLASIGRDMANLRRSWSQLSVKVRHAIDTCIRRRGKAPKWALRSAGSGYLEWMFVLQPYIEDMQTVMDFLSSTSKSLLKRYSYTKNRKALEKVEHRTHGGQYYGGLRSLVYDHQHTEIYSVHLAIGWVCRGPLPSDGSFAEKARRMNRDLGIWYPSLIWDLMPWTWLIDWCTHLGASINGMHAISDSNFRPAYAWATVRNTVRCFGSFVPNYRGDTVETNFAGAENTSLCRIPVQTTGLLMPSFSELSTSQKAILGALGLSHLK